MWTLGQNYVNIGTKLCEHWHEIIWTLIGKNYLNIGTKIREHWDKTVWRLGENYVNIGTKLYELWNKIIWTLEQNRNSEIEVDHLELKKCCTYDS